MPFEAIRLDSHDFHLIFSYCTNGTDMFLEVHLKMNSCLLRSIIKQMVTRVGGGKHEQQLKKKKTEAKRMAAMITWS